MTYQLLPKKGMARATLLADLADPNSEIYQAVVATGALDPRVSRGLTTYAALGDSITSNHYTGFGVWLRLLSLQFVGVPGWNKGVSGNTTAQMLARISDVTGLDPKPDVCLVLGGTNDANVGDADATLGNLSAIYDALLDADIIPVAMLIPPRDTNTDFPPKINGRIAAEAMRRGIPLVNFYHQLADGDGTWRSTYSHDGIHPNLISGRIMAQAIIDALDLRGPGISAFLAASNTTDDTNLVTNGTFIGDANADGVADGWSLTVGGTATGTLTPGTGNVVGNWQDIDVTVAGQTYISGTNITTGFTAGDVMLYCGRVKSDNFASGFWIDQLNIYPSGGGGISCLYQFDTELNDEAEGYVFAVMWKITTETAISPRFIGKSTGTGNMSIAQVAIRNLTELGAY